MNNINSKRFELLPILARTSPVCLTIIMILYAMMLPSFNSFYLTIFVLLTNGSNFFLKYAIMKPLYKWSGGNDIFFLGSGSRPTGAMSCQFAIDGKKATSFGMPSGHSQIAWTIGTYLICNLITRFINNLYKQTKTNTTPTTSSTSSLVLYNMWIFISIIIILGAMIYISYSRVYIEGCHTIQQVFIGGILGVVFGFLGFYFENDIKLGIFGSS